MGKCYNRIAVDKPIEEVWQAVSDFHDMGWAEGVITSVEKVGSVEGHHIGAKRILNNAFHETLIDYDNFHHRFAYRIEDGPGPVSHDSVKDYIGIVQLTEMPEGTLVEWSSSYRSKNESEVAEFCNPIYTALLDAMRKNIH